MKESFKNIAQNNQHREQIYKKKQKTKKKHKKVKVTVYICIQVKVYRWCLNTSVNYLEYSREF